MRQCLGRLLSINIMDSIDLRFTYTEAEQVDAVRLYYDKALQGRRSTLIALLCIGFGCLIGFGWHDWVFAELLIALGAAILAMIGYSYFILPYRTYRNDPKLKNEFHLTFSDNGIHFQTSNIDSQIGWGLYHTVWRSRDLLVLVHGKRTMTILPLRAFSSQDDIEIMNRLLERNVTKSA